ncbi:type II 3-dehydroquinate dehydratase [Parasphingorhabdus sp.]|uniref:type II 3-dehydroquinate dehydratase n=1 Tax=Parasphingorhabdus sp. TaxID=2709688 RepID=UPI0030B0ADC9
MAAKTIFVLNGPNLNMLGMREPEVYGSETLDEIAGQIEDHAQTLGFDVDIRQSNHEGHLVDWLHEAAAKDAHAIILNAGALTHTSLSLSDAIKAISTPVIEVHISNPAAREEYRHKSFIAPVAKGTICGFGAFGYQLALDAANQF